MKTFLRFSALAALTLAVGAVFATPSARAVEIVLPGEAARLADSPLPGAALAAAMCYTCHSADYVLYQPPASSRAYWNATVTKMQKTFGAPLPDNALDPLTDYLVKTYGAERTPATTPPLNSAPTPVPAVRK